MTGARPRWPLLVLALLVPLAGAPHCYSNGLNVPLDSDLDGLADLVRVDDFDGDGVLEMDDVQDAVESLTDPGPKRVEVWPGTYLPPAAPGSRPGRSHALVELPSRTTLSCPAGPAFTQLRGPSGTDVAHDFAVVANDDTVGGNEDIVVRGCDIHGGAPDAYVGSTFSVNRRLGVYFRGTQRSRVEDSVVHHTFHTGLYTSNSRGDAFLNNVIHDAGGWGNQTRYRTSYPCIYLFSVGGRSVEDFVARGNRMSRCAASGLNTRAEDVDAPGDVIRNLLWEDNEVEDTGFATPSVDQPAPAGSACASLRGVDGAVVRNLICRSTGPVGVSNYATNWLAQGNENASSNVLIEDVVVDGADTIAGVFIGDYVENLTVRRVSVLGTRANDGRVVDIPCLQFEEPLRGAVFEDLDLVACGQAGVFEGSVVGSGASPGTSLRFSRVRVDGADVFDPIDPSWRPGFWFQGIQRGIVLEDVEVRHATGPEIWFSKTVVNARLSRITIESSDPGWLGAFHEAAVPACDASREKRWITTRNGTSISDCNFAPGGQGTVSARCACRSGFWSPLSPANVHPGILFSLSGASSRQVRLEDVSVSNARGHPGVRVDGNGFDFDVLGIEGRDDSEATDLPQSSAIRFTGNATDIVVQDATCLGTDPAYACVELPPAP